MIRLEVKKIFKVVFSTFKKERQLTGGTQCQTAPNGRFRIETGGPQTKITIQLPHILKALVEEKKIYEVENGVSLKLFKFEYPKLIKKITKSRRKLQ